MLWDSEEISKSLLNEFNILTMVLDTGGDNEALLWGDVVHNKLLEHAGVNVRNVRLESESWHTEGSISIGSLKKEILVVSEWIVLGQVLVEIVRLLVLGSGNVSSEDRLWLKSNIDHHLEHISDIVLNTVSLEVHSFLIVVHSHVTTRHLDHSVVNGLVSMLKSFEVSVLEGKEGSGALWGLVTSSNINQETHMNCTWEDLALSQNSESIVKVCYVVFWLDFILIVWFETLKLDSWVVGGHIEGLGGGIDLVEEFMDDTWR